MVFSGVKVSHVTGDVLDRDAVTRACEGVDCCVHLAAVNGTDNFYRFPELTLRVAVLGTYGVLDACAANSVKTVVLASSSEVYHEAAVPTAEKVPLTIPDVKNPRFSYAGGKMLLELLGQHAGGIERVMVVRPHNIYGPDMGRGHVIPQLIEQALKWPCRSLEIEGDGTEYRAYCHVDDFVEGLLLVIEKGQHRGIYNIGNDEVTPAGLLARQIVKFLGSENNIVSSGYLPAGSPRWRFPDISKLRALGYEPRVKLVDGLPGVVKWYKENPA